MEQRLRVDKRRKAAMLTTLELVARHSEHKAHWIREYGIIYKMKPYLMKKRLAENKRIQNAIAILLRDLKHF